MPKIKFEHIVSFSSEDPKHVANNILSNDTNKKWRCKTPGEKQAVVVLQLEKASIITGIDIGNELSAYIEVLVTRSGSEDDYKVLLVMSTFMTPLEARQSTNGNKVRMFTQDELSKPECNEKWDRVKIVCTQPFNRHIQYGLSFVTLHSNEKTIGGDAVSQKIGKFALRAESPDNLSIGSLFSRRKEIKDEESLKGAAAIRQAGSTTSLSQYGSPVCKPRLKPGTPKAENNKHGQTSTTKERQSRSRDELLYTEDEEQAHEKIDNIIQKKAEEDKTKADNEEKVKAKQKQTPHRKTSNDTDSPNSTPKDKRTRVSESFKRKLEEPSTSVSTKKPKKKLSQGKPFAFLLNGVKIVISGIQNPDRGELRAKALEMGATYKADWDSSCTHLICAFANTPKFNQVRGKGKIVTRNWVEDCYKERKRLPWRRYALDRKDQGLPVSEDEISACEEQSSEDEDENIVETIQVEEKTPSRQGGFYSDAELAKIREKKKDQILGNGTNEYNQDTDEEDVSTPDVTLLPAKKLPNFFEKKTFFIDQNFNRESFKMLTKYITAYAGELSDDPTENIDVFVSTRDHCSILKEINSEPLCLGASWVFDCHNKQKLLPIDDYVL